MSEWVQEVVEVESPVHIDEVIRRIRDAAGLERAGEAIQHAIRQGVQHANKVGKILRDGDFLWFQRIHPVSVRNRANFPNPYKKLDLVHSAEIKVAIIQLVRESFGITRQEIGASVLRDMGFERTTDLMRERVDDLINELLAEDALSEQNGKLRLHDT
jgi:hypothetical protein